MRSPLFVMLAAVSCLSLPIPANAATITITCGSVGVEHALCLNAVAQWEAITGHEVEVYSPPMAPEQQLELYRQLLETESPDVDVFQIAITWPGLLGEHFIDLRPHFDAEHVASHFDSIISGLTRDDALLAMPWFTDAPMLYYRADLLEKYQLSVPVTWDQMTEAARVIQEGERASGNDRFWGLRLAGQGRPGADRQRPGMDQQPQWRPHRRARWRDHRQQPQCGQGDRAGRLPGLARSPRPRR